MHRIEVGHWYSWRGCRAHATAAEQGEPVDRRAAVEDCEEKRVPTLRLEDEHLRAKTFALFNAPDNRAAAE